MIPFPQADEHIPYYGTYIKLVPPGTDILALRCDALFPLILQSSVGDVAGAEY